ncbi:MocR-like pyridoxine biosynthesis transcription factor PdxR [Isachenkonia alkalipeptolytica]|uniref:PLP-dependent aminotransferase family protein n=1 Tax=Isachenkonia alkalipeptolytica TaxID=2565777 RepID=A0AA43XMY7_9CLOT|nr:PLP-dependent aminotransferase family protein [Isachenkonia alkalipeptolytica]NBG89672.1 PLP-dependent aminotransferase family protein [Isachenkonia alkalipeptolytica]
MENYRRITLNKEGEDYLYQQLARQLMEMMEEKVIKGEERLPSIKTFAEFLGVNIATVVRAYEVLEEKDYILKKSGSGCFVKSREERILNFASGTPSYDFFPIEDFKKIINHVMDKDGAKAFEYTQGQGDPELRRELRLYIQKYNIQSHEEQIHVISGAQQGIDLIAKALLSQRDTVIIENPSYTGAIGAFKSKGVRLKGVPIKNDGIDLKKLEETIKQTTPKLLYVMPNFQNPTGTSYSSYQKNKLLALAKEYDFYILEDDYLSDLSFYSQDNRTLKSMDKENKVIYLKSFSKIFMPGLRLGFLVVPEELQSSLREAKLISDISTSGLLQRALKEYMGQGLWGKHIEALKNLYQKRFDLAMKEISAQMPGNVKFTFPKGGLNFWFELPEGMREQEFISQLEAMNIIVAPGHLFFHEPSHKSYFRMSIANVEDKDIPRGMEKITTLIRWESAERKKVKDPLIL